MFEMYARSSLFHEMVAQESQHLFQRHLRWRWFFALGLWGALLLAGLMDRPAFVVASGGAIVAAFTAYTLFLQWSDWRGRAGHWTVYANILVDHLLLTGHLLLIARAIAPESVVWSPANLLFPFISLYTALRLDYRGLALSLVCNLAALNLVFFLSRPALDLALVARLPELGLDGHVFRVLFTLSLGLCFFTIPLGLRHLLAKQEALFRTRQGLQERYRQDLEREVAAKTAQLRQANQELQTTLDEVRTLEGLLPICSRCKKIKDQDGRWLGMEQYLANRANVRITHGLCEQCFAIIYPDIAEEVIVQLRDLEAKGK